MAYLTDIEIAQACKLKPISEIANKIGLSVDDIEFYGKYKAKVNLNQSIVITSSIRTEKNEPE